MGDKHRIIHDIIVSFTPVMADANDHLRVLTDMLYAVFDAGGQHADAEIRALKDSSYKLMYHMQILVDELRFCEVTNYFGHTKKLIDLLPNDTVEKVRTLMKGLELSRPA